MRPTFDEKWFLGEIKHQLEIDEKKLRRRLKQIAVGSVK